MEAAPPMRMDTLESSVVVMEPDTAEERESHLETESVPETVQGKMIGLETWDQWKGRMVRMLRMTPEELRRYRQKPQYGYGRGGGKGLGYGDMEGQGLVHHTEVDRVGHGKGLGGGRGRGEGYGNGMGIGYGVGFGSGYMNGEGFRRRTRIRTLENTKPLVQEHND